MAIYGVSGSSAAAIEAERQVAVLKKAQDIQKASAEALLELVKQAPAPTGDVGRLISVRA